MSTFLNFIEQNILYEILVALWILFFWKLYLSLRQKALVLRLVELPREVQGLMTKEVYDKARAYSLDKLNFGIFEDAYSEIFNTVFLLTMCHRRFWIASIRLVSYFGFDESNEILLSGVCMFIITVVYDMVYLPLNIYSTFVVEQKHGFNKETPLFFAKDQLLKFIVSEAIAVPLLSAVIWIIKNGGDYFFLYLWLFLIAATLFLMILYPEVIAPLFDKYTTLPDGELKKRIEELAASISFPLYKVFIVENSKRSSHSNAYLYGFHKHKRIVLFDTLVKEYYKPMEGETATEAKGCETDEILAVLAHELGHWKHRHTLKGYVISQISLLINLFLYAELVDYKPMFEAFGFTDSRPTFIGVIIVTMYILIPFNVLLQFLTIVIARKFEFQADRFAKSLGHGAALKSSLIKLHKDNLCFPIFDKLYASWHHNHPQLLERLDAINKED